MHQYNRVTGDLGFLLDQGAEVLVETARFWMRLGFFSERRDGRFCIHSVTGPDEYTTVVDNNAYTNLMAKENLEVATRVVEWLQGADPAAHADARPRHGADRAEVDDWRRAAELHVRPARRASGRRAAGRPASSSASAGTSTPRRRRSTRCSCTTTRSSCTGTR